MKKMLIGVTEAQNAWLRKAAAKAGITLSEFIRRILDKERTGK